MEDAEARSARAAYLMAAAGHDLRQPLQVIAMALDRIAPGLSDPRGREWLQIAAGEVSRLNAGLSELALAARLAEPDLSLVDVAEILRAAAEGWRHHAMARGLRLRVIDRPWVVKTDPRLLMTVVRNLVGNAVQHTAAGGVLVACRRRADGVRIDVVDTGPGLPEGELGALFEPYRRGKADGEGLGLGLTLVRDAADRLGCGLSVCSRPGKGARFSVTIPD
jgi:signal transduction histidine kinase